MFKALLGNRSLLTLGLAESISGIGNWITMLAVFALVVFRGNGRVLESSGIFLAGLAPMLLASPAAGWLVDRFDRKRLMIASELLSGLIVAGLIFTDRLALIYTLLALQALSISMMTPARQAVVPDLVPREKLTQANAFLQQLAGIIKIGAPMLAGLILTIVTPHQAIILDVISFGISALILARLPSLRPPRASQPAEAGNVPERAARPVVSLLMALRSLPLLRLLFVLIFLVTTVIIGFDVLSSLFTRDVLHGNETFFSLLIGLVGLGAVSSTTALLWLKKESSPWRDLIMGVSLLACIPVFIALAAWIESPALARLMAAVGCLLGGAGNGLLVVQIGTLLQLLSPPALLGRVGGLFQSTVVAGQLAGLLITPLLVPVLFSMPAYFGLAGLALALSAIYTAFTLRRSQAKMQTTEPAVG